MKKGKSKEWALLDDCIALVIVGNGIIAGVIVFASYFPKVMG